jgi:hypothetical protein
MARRSVESVSGGPDLVRRRSLRWCAAGLAGLLLGLAGPAWRGALAEEPPNGIDLARAAAGALAKATLGDATTPAGRADRASWSLIAGELAADPNGPRAFTGAIDLLADGLKELDSLVRELASDPDLERAIAGKPEVAMRLDAARVRRERAAATLDQAREQERARLAQLRELVRAYRDAANALAVSNAHVLLGDDEAARSAYARAVDKLAELEAVVSRRRDYYLFSDEPALGDAASPDPAFITSAPEPFAPEIRPHLVALQALAAYRLATGRAGQPDGEGLVTALKLADAAPAANGRPSPLAAYVRAGAHRGLALAETAADPLAAAAHDRARPHCEAARAALKERDGLGLREAAALRGVQSECATWARELAAPEPFLERARELTAQGRAADAHAELGRGLAHHRAAPLLLARLEAARRAGTDLDSAASEYRRGCDEALLDPSDARTRLVGAKLGLAACWKQATEALERLGAVERQELLERIASNERLLEPAAGVDPSGPEAERFAYRALAVALRAMVDPGPEGRPRQEAALREARTAAAELNRRLPGEAAEAQLASREALVACRLAQGYLALRVLPDYRDDAANAFAAAADEQARLPFQTSALKVFGSPLVTALLSRPEGQAMRLAHEERQIRQVLTRFLDGAFAQAAGNRQTAARQMAGALELAGAAGGLLAPGTPLDAGHLLDSGDDSDAKQAILRTLRSYAALGYAQAGQGSRALAEAIRACLGDVLPTAGDAATTAAITPARVEQAIHASEDPLLAYALGTALEVQAASQPAADAARTWFQLALQAHRRARTLFEAAPAEAQRHAAPADANARALARLESPASDLEQAHRLCQTDRAGEAVALLREAMRRHPAAPAVRAELAGALRDQVVIGQAPATLLREALAVLDVPGAAPPEIALLQGEIHERLGEPGPALRSYRAVLTGSATPEQRAQARSRAALLAARYERE